MYKIQGDCSCELALALFWVTQSFLAAREIWAKPIFKEVSMFFYYYFGEIYIFYFILKSAW